MNEPNFFTGEYSYVHRKTDDVIFNNNNNSNNSNNQFVIDDLLVDFPNHDDDVVLNDEFFDNVIGSSADSETVTAVDSCNSSVAGSDVLFSGNVSSHSFSESQFSGVELSLPYDDVAELEWLSTFTQDSFSTVDIHNLQLISAAKTSPATATSSSVTTVPYRTNSQIFQTDVVFIPVKARSKRTRTAPYDWTSRILHIKQPLKHTIKIKANKTVTFKRREVVLEQPSVIKCLHCGSEKTPQWRTGPMGPKTLCNACGVRYKSGRLVPEYRPAASPTFVSAKHSNSHRKVMEIRRQKEVRNGGNGFGDRSSGFVGSDCGDGCLIDRQCGPGFMHMI
ncbi:putative transcription factor C2C2-GATA family [Helianthus debilis subsp. tardiflorus]